MGLDRKDFGKSLANERKKLGLSVNQMAELCGVKAGAQYLYEKGNRLPNVDYLERAISIGAAPEKLLPSLKEKELYSLETIIEIIQLADSRISEDRAELIRKMLSKNPGNKTGIGENEIKRLA